METTKHELSRARIHRLKTQGYLNHSDSEICELAFGHRFALISCTIIVGIGLALGSAPILAAMSIVALGGVFLPYHPFDYIFNFFLSGPFHRKKVPPRSKQLKFACSIASSGLAITAFLFFLNFTLAGYIVGVSLFLVAFTVSTTDYCLPSKIYNFIFKVEVD